MVLEGREQEPVTAWCYQPAGIVLRRAVYTYRLSVTVSAKDWAAALPILGPPSPCHKHRDFFFGGGGVAFATLHLIRRTGRSLSESRHSTEMQAYWGDDSAPSPLLSPLNGFSFPRLGPRSVFTSSTLWVQQLPRVAGTHRHVPERSSKGLGVI